MCLKRNAASPAKVASAGRTRSLSTRASRLPRTDSRDADVSSSTAPRWNTSPSTAPHSSVALSAGSSRSRRAPSSAWRLVGNVSSSRSPSSEQTPSSMSRTPSSTSIATSSSTKSGLPPDAAARRASTAGSATPSSPARSPSTSSLASGSSATVTSQSGRCSDSSGRARQRSMIGTGPIASGRPAIRSSRVDSAHWMSSTTTTRGRSAAPATRRSRIAAAVSSVVVDPSARPSSCAILVPTSRPSAAPSRNDSISRRASSWTCSSLIRTSSRTIWVTAQ